MFGNGWFDNGGNSNDNDVLDRIQQVCEQVVEDVATGWDMTVYGIEMLTGQHDNDNDENNDDDD